MNRAFTLAISKYELWQAFGSSKGLEGHHVTWGLSGAKLPVVDLLNWIELDFSITVDSVTFI